MRGVLSTSSKEEEEEDNIIEKYSEPSYVWSKLKAFINQWNVHNNAN
jgi:hypothetical protein